MNGRVWLALAALVGPVAAQQLSTAATAQVTLVEVVDNSGEVSFSLPLTGNHISGPPHSPELCIHPSPKPPRWQDDEPGPQPVHHFSVDVEAPPDQCVVHVADALNSCAKMAGCQALTCLPTLNYQSLDPAQVVTDQGGIIGHTADSANLLTAVQDGLFAQVQHILEHGNADIDAVEAVGERTALMFAVQRGDIALVELLLAFAADPDLVDSQGRTAADYSRDHNTYRPHQTLDLEEGNLVDTDELHKDVTHLEIDAMLAKQSAAFDLARRRIQADKVRSQEHERVMLRTLVASTPRAERARDLLEQGIQGPICLARAHTAINLPNSQRCTENRDTPRPRCTNLFLSQKLLAEVIDLRRLHTSVARRLAPGLSAGRMLLALPGGDLDDEPWYEAWRLRSDWVGVAPAIGGGERTLVFVV